MWKMSGGDPLAIAAVIFWTYGPVSELPGTKLSLNATSECSVVYLVKSSRNAFRSGPPPSVCQSVSVVFAPLWPTAPVASGGSIGVGAGVGGAPDGLAASVGLATAVGAAAASVGAAPAGFGASVGLAGTAVGAAVGADGCPHAARTAPPSPANPNATIRRREIAPF